MEEIKNILEEWFYAMLSKYPNGLSFRYEFNKRSERYFVVYYTTNELSNDYEFNRLVLDFEDKLDDLYGMTKSPLFCENEDLFTLSPEAKTFYPAQEVNSYVIDNIFTSIECDVLFCNNINLAA